jgi:hypothetical protein
MGDNGGNFGENSTEFQSNDSSEKDVPINFMPNGEYAGEEGFLQVLKRMVLLIFYLRDGRPFIRRMKRDFMENGLLVKQVVTNSNKYLMD